jgi:hypothetical protein
VRFHVGPIPEDATFDPEAGEWTLLREPGTTRVMLTAIPLGALMSGVLTLVWILFVPLDLPGDSLSFTITLPGLLLAFLLLTGFALLHEFLHAVPAVIAGSSSSVIIGFWPRYFAPYFAYLGALPRNVQLACGVAPLLGLTMLPFGIALVFPAVAVWMAALSVVNVLGSAADMVMLALILRQVPSGAFVRNQGRFTWWRLP